MCRHTIPGSISSILEGDVLAMKNLFVEVLQRLEIEFVSLST